jgi:hypothetical protein
MRQIFLGFLVCAALLFGTPLALAGNVTITGGYISAGAGQYAVSITGTASSLTVPAGSEIAEICVETAGVRYRDDGTAPTSSNGIPVVPTSTAPACFQYGGPLNKIQFIAISGSPTIDVSYYKTSQ